MNSCKLPALPCQVANLVVNEQESRFWRGAGGPRIPNWMLKRITLHEGLYVGHRDGVEMPHPEKPEQMLSSINITRFMLEELQLTAEDTVVIKMDIEESEWEVLPGEAEPTGPNVRRVVTDIARLVGCRLLEGATAFCPCSPSCLANNFARCSVTVSRRMRMLVPPLPSCLLSMLLLRALLPAWQHGFASRGWRGLWTRSLWRSTTTTPPWPPSTGPQNASATRGRRPPHYSTASEQPASLCTHGPS